MKVARKKARLNIMYIDCVTYATRLGWLQLSKAVSGRIF